MISVSLVKRYHNVRISLNRLEEIVQFVCRKEKISDGELSFVIINERTMRGMNKKFLTHDYSTDIITFPLEKMPLQAEVFINGEKIKSQAKEFKVSEKNELIRLIVHGTLHALGYSDKTTMKKKRMYELQEKYVVQLS